MKLPGKRWVTEQLRRAKARRNPHLTILGYHRVAHAPFDPFDLAITPEEFDAQLTWLSGHAHIVPLTEGLRALGEGTLAPRSVALTFDDGYDDTLDRVLPALERHGAAATVFVTTGNPGQPFWWDSFAAIMMEPRVLPDRLDLRIGTQRIRASGGDREALLWQLSEALHPLEAEERAHSLAELLRWTGEPLRFRSPRALTREELARLGQHPLITLGAHTVTHPPLPLRDAETQRREIQESIDAIEAVYAHPVSLFSYPHGAISRQTQEIVRATGISYACASMPDVTYRTQNPFALPRLWVDGPRRHAFPDWIAKWL